MPRVGRIHGRDPRSDICGRDREEDRVDRVAKMRGVVVHRGKTIEREKADQPGSFGSSGGVLGAPGVEADAAVGTGTKVALPATVFPDME